MKTSFRIFLLIFLVFLLFITHVMASNIDMNLPSDEFIDENLTENTYTANEIESDAETPVENESDLTDTETAETPRVVSTSSTENDEFLTAENIISIIIIVIGILLIFLAGAILVRINK